MPSNVASGNKIDTTGFLLGQLGPDLVRQGDKLLYKSDSLKDKSDKTEQSKLADHLLLAKNNKIEASKSLRQDIVEKLQTVNDRIKESTGGLYSLTDISKIEKGDTPLTISEFKELSDAYTKCIYGLSVLDQDNAFKGFEEKDSSERLIIADEAFTRLLAVNLEPTMKTSFGLKVNKELLKDTEYGKPAKPSNSSDHIEHNKNDSRENTRAKGIIVESDSPDSMNKENSDNSNLDSTRSDISIDDLESLHLGDSTISASSLRESTTPKNPIQKQHSGYSQLPDDGSLDGNDIPEEDITQVLMTKTTAETKSKLLNNIHFKDSFKKLKARVSNLFDKIIHSKKSQQPNIESKLVELNSSSSVVRNNNGLKPSQMMGAIKEAEVLKSRIEVQILNIDKKLNVKSPSKLSQKERNNLIEKKQNLSNQLDSLSGKINERKKDIASFVNGHKELFNKIKSEKNKEELKTENRKDNLQVIENEEDDWDFTSGLIQQVPKEIEEDISLEEYELQEDFDFDFENYDKEELELLKQLEPNVDEDKKKPASEKKEPSDKTLRKNSIVVDPTLNDSLSKDDPLHIIFDGTKDKNNPFEDKNLPDIDKADKTNPFS